MWKRRCRNKSPFLCGLLCGAIIILLFMVSWRYVLLFLCIAALLCLLKKNI